jgi:hypothetical protein
MEEKVLERGFPLSRQVYTTDTSEVVEGNNFETAA